MGAVRLFIGHVEHSPCRKSDNKRLSQNDRKYALSKGFHFMLALIWDSSRTAGSSIDNIVLPKTDYNKIMHSVNVRKASKQGKGFIYAAFGRGMFEIFRNCNGFVTSWRRSCFKLRL